jgi:hypothetical protein
MCCCGANPENLLSILIWINLPHLAEPSLHHQVSQCSSKSVRQVHAKSTPSLHVSTGTFACRVSQKNAEPAKKSPTERARIDLRSSISQNSALSQIISINSLQVLTTAQTGRWFSPACFRRPRPVRRRRRKRPKPLNRILHQITEEISDV